MLTGIPPLLTGAVLAALDRMGHGDELVVADANFPAHHLGPAVVELAGTGAPAVVRAVRTLLPLDTYEGPSVCLMRSGLSPQPAVQVELLTAVSAPADRVEELDRHVFYWRAATASLIIRTGETRPYGNLVLRKGVVLDDRVLPRPA